MQEQPTLAVEICGKDLVMVLNQDKSVIWHRSFPFSIIGEITTADVVVVPSPVRGEFYATKADGFGLLFEILPAHTDMPSN